MNNTDMVLTTTMRCSAIKEGSYIILRGNMSTKSIICKGSKFSGEYKKMIMLNIQFNFL